LPHGSGEIQAPIVKSGTRGWLPLPLMAAAAEWLGDNWRLVNRLVAGVIGVAFWVAGIIHRTEFGTFFPLLFAGFVMSAIAVGTWRDWRARRRGALLALLAAFFALSGGVLWLAQPRQPPQVEVGTPRLTLVAPRRLPDGAGSYVLPLKIENVGNLDILNETYLYVVTTSDHPLSPTEEDAAFAAAMAGFADHVRARELVPPGTTFARIGVGRTVEVIDTNRLPPALAQSIIAGQRFAYGFLKMRYTDQQSFKLQKYFYAEFCARYRADGGGGGIPCVLHNFLGQAAD
jgi:hypothetical protein